MSKKRLKKDKGVNFISKQESSNKLELLKKEEFDRLRNKFDRKNKKNRQRRSRGQVLKSILKNINEGVTNTGDLFLAFMNAGYNATYKGVEYQLRKIQIERSQIEEKIKRERNFKKMLSKLKTQRLIKDVGDDKYKITSKGKEKLKELVDKFLPKKVYSQEESDDIIIVIFDIPEEYRNKRDWLRRVLVSLDFKIHQQSVWVGENKIPKELIEDIYELEINEYIDIFKASRVDNFKKEE